ALARGLVGADDDGSGPHPRRRGAAQHVERMVIAPSLTISASGEHGGFPGTLSLGSAVFEQVLVELVRSADWSSGVVLVNGHGGNAVAVGRAVHKLTEERRRVLSWWPRDNGGDAHAGVTETSLMLAIAPELVRLDAAAAGRTEPVSQLAEELVRDGVLAVSPNGVLGDPAGATASHGRNLLTRLTIDLIAAVDEWWV
ncbi:MAG: mycofactocin biosynthesis peptidyl-dipeptidase MftE, partial [Ilumatobacteraceae bacterium]